MSLFACIPSPLYHFLSLIFNTPLPPLPPTLVAPFLNDSLVYLSSLSLDSFCVSYSSPKLSNDAICSFHDNFIIIKHSFHGRCHKTFLSIKIPLTFKFGCTNVRRTFSKQFFVKLQSKFQMEVDF